MEEQNRQKSFMDYIFVLNDWMYKMLVFPAQVVIFTLTNIRDWVTTHTVSCTICLCVTLTATFSVASLAIGLGIGLGVGCAQTRIVQTNSNSG